MEKEKLDQLAEKAAGGAGSVGRTAAQFRANAELIGEVASDLAVAIGELTAAFRAASDASDRSAGRMASLTKVLVGATVAYVLIAGAGLLVDVFGEPKIAYVAASARQPAN